MGDRYAQSKQLDKACSLRPEARQLSLDDFDPEPRESVSRPFMVDLAILLTACSVCLTWATTASAHQVADAATPYKQSEVPVERRVDDLLHRMTLEEKVRQLDLYSGATALVDKHTDDTHAASGAVFLPDKSGIRVGDPGSGRNTRSQSDPGAG